MYCKAGIELNRAHLIGPAAGRAHECLLWLCAGALIGREGDMPAQSLSRVNRIRQCLPLPLPVPKSHPMTTHPLIDLTTPTRDVFQLVVHACLATPQPLGSRTLSKPAPLPLSPPPLRTVLQNSAEFGLSLRPPRTTP